MEGNYFNITFSWTANEFRCILLYPVISNMSMRKCILQLACNIMLYVSDARIPCIINVNALSFRQFILMVVSVVESLL